MKTIVSFFLILISLFSFGQGPKPSGTLKLIPSPAIFKRPADSTLHLYQGPALGWDRLLTGRDSLATGGSGIAGDNYGYWRIVNGAPADFSVNYGYLYNWAALADTTITITTYMGYLYNWWAISSGSGNIAAANAHVPSRDEWFAFRDYLTSVSPGNEGGILKETGFTYWNSPNTGATNSTEFNARGGGSAYINHTFGGWGIAEAYWSTDMVPGDLTQAYAMYLRYDDAILNNDNDLLNNGFHIRLIVDTPIEIVGDNGIYVGNDGHRYPCKRYPYGGGSGIFWLTQNLMESKLSDLSDLAYVTDATAWSTLSTGAYCSYDDLISNAFTSSTTIRSIANSNAHVPTVDDWNGLLSYMTSIDPGNEGSQLKEAGLEHWNSPNEGASNRFGFNARGGGARWGNGQFSGLKDNFIAWTGTPLGASAYDVYMGAGYPGAGTDNDDQKMAASIRLIVDTPNTMTSDTTGTYVQNDGTVLKVKLIGETFWTTESLVETLWSDGSAIPNVTDSVTWSNLTGPGYCSYNNYLNYAFTPEGTGGDLLVRAKHRVYFKDTASLSWTKTLLPDSTIQLEANVSDSIAGGGGGGGGISSTGLARHIPRWNDSSDSLIASPLYVTGADSALISTLKFGDSYGDNLLLGQEDSSHPRDSTFTGSSNTIIGSRAVPFLSFGSGNTVLGNVAGYYLGSSNNNTLMGFQAGSQLTDQAHRNIMIGVQSGTNAVRDSDMVMIGNGSMNDQGGDPLHNSIAIGNRSSVTLSNMVAIGNDSTNYTRLYGKVWTPELQVTSTGFGEGKILMSDITGTLRYTDLPTGSGSVSNVTIVPANGISGTVANGTTTPAITLSIGAINPTSTNGVTAAKMAYMDATSSIQTQLDGKAPVYTGGVNFIPKNVTTTTFGNSPFFTGPGQNFKLSTYYGSNSDGGNVWFGGGGGNSVGVAGASINGSFNSAFGYSAGLNSTTGYYNTFIGAYSGCIGTITGNNNCGIGISSLQGLTSGSGNVGNGSFSMALLTTGKNNTGIGYQSGYGGTGLITGSKNTFIGALTGPYASSDTLEVAIGYSVTGKGSNTITLGNSTNTATYLNGAIYGIVYPYISVSAAYTATATDMVINCGGTGTYNITLPSAVGITGRPYYIKKTGTSTTSVTTTSGQTIDGALSYSLTSQYSKVLVVSDGSNWIII